MHEQFASGVLCASYNELVIIVSLACVTLGWQATISRRAAKGTRAVACAVDKHHVAMTPHSAAD